MKCAKPDCKAPAKTRGYCARHYSYLHYHGKIEVRKNAPFGQGEVFIDDAIVSDTKTCILWPYGLDKDGYGQATYKSKHWRVHRLICTLVHGEPPAKSDHAAHSCGNPRCCNPSHLSWKTIKANMHDKWLHGTMYSGARHHKSKLTEVQVLAIVADPRGSTTVGREYGITKHAVQAIRNGDSWAALTGIKRKAA